MYSTFDSTPMTSSFFWFNTKLRIPRFLQMISYIFYPQNAICQIKQPEIWMPRKIQWAHQILPPKCYPKWRIFQKRLEWLAVVKHPNNFFFLVSYIHTRWVLKPKPHSASILIVMGKISVIWIRALLATQILNLGCIKWA